MVSANVYVQRVLVSLAGIQLLKVTLENMLKIMNQQMGGKYRKMSTFIMKEVMCPQKTSSGRRWLSRASVSTQMKHSDMGEQCRMIM